MAATAALLGFPLPMAPLSWSESVPSAARLAPREWLIRGGSAAAISARLEGVDHLCVEVGPGRRVWRLAGAGVRDLLSSGCAIDLHPAAFPVGRCVRTRLAGVEAVISRLDETGFELIVESSVADYVGAWLRDAAAGFDR